jgi:hypothetical protein
MLITTQIQTTDPNYPYDATQAADQVLAALGGNPTNDTCTVSMTMPSAIGHAGV